MPDFLFDNVEQIAEELRGDAKKNDAGKFVLNLVPKTKLDEFRENNIKLSKERDDLSKVVAKVLPIVGEDADKFAEELAALRAVDQKVKDGTLTKKDDIENEIAKRIANMKEGYDKQTQAQAKEISDLKLKNSELDAGIKRVHIDRAVTAEVLNEKSGANPEALAHILQEAYKVFVVQPDGTLIPKNGEATIYGSDGATPMSVLEWLGKLSEKHSYLFKNSNGGGASGGKDTAFGGLSKEAFAKLKPEQKLALANRKQ